MRSSPLFDHVHEESTSFTPSSLLDAVVLASGLPHRRVPEIVILEFDGDLYDALVAGGAPPCRTWACFHTPMCIVEVGTTPCGVVPRTIGGPYATLVAEQLFESGARVVVGVTSAGRVRSGMKLPHFVVADAAIRDEERRFTTCPLTEPSRRRERSRAASMKSSTRSRSRPIVACSGRRTLPTARRQRCSRGVRRKAPSPSKCRRHRSSRSPRRGRGGRRVRHQCRRRRVRALRQRTA